MKDFPSLGKIGSSRLIRQKPESERKATIKLIATWVVLFFVALFFVQQRIDYIQTSRNVERLIEEKNKLLGSILPLKLEVRYLTQPQKIETVAKKELWLEQPLKKTIIEIPLYRNDP
ncbi:MAG: cell division protein FtsL [Deltaproteobacteria bacterium]|nr:cell division protein FtsL [Deltaproteobacteria bacterium]